MTDNRHVLWVWFMEQKMHQQIKRPRLSMFRKRDEALQRAKREADRFTDAVNLCVTLGLSVLWTASDGSCAIILRSLRDTSGAIVATEESFVRTVERMAMMLLDNPSGMSSE